MKLYIVIIFKRCLKEETDSEFLIRSGRLFQIIGA